MKKLLSLIGALTLVGTATGPVIACGTKEQNNAQAEVDKIKNKIKNYNLRIVSNPIKTVKANTAAIKQALKDANPTLTTADLATITFNAVTLIAGSATNITATITVASATASKTLNVRMLQSDKEKVDAIASKIRNVALTVSSDTNVSTANQATIVAIKTALRGKNSMLTDDDVAKITFNTVTLVVGQATNVTATITVDSATTTKTLNVLIARTNQQKVDAIKDKITYTDLIIAANNQKGVGANTTAIKTALKSNNSTLINADLAKITFSSGAFIPGTPLSVIATITIGSATTTIRLNVTMAQTNQQKVYAIIEKITSSSISLSPVQGSAAISTTTPIIKTAIKTSLKTANPTLTTADETAITVPDGVALTRGATKQVALNIQIGTAIATKNIQVTVLKSDQQKADTIKNKISDNNIVIPNNLQKAYSANTAAIRTALRGDNTALTTSDLSKITFGTGTFTPGTAQNVTATITIGTAAITKNLSVTMAATDQEKTQAIADKISNVNISIAPVPGTGAISSTTPSIKSKIKAALQNANSGLSNDDLNYVIVPDGVTLTRGTAVQVTISIRVNSATAVNKNTQVTVLQSDIQKANVIKSKIRDVNLTIPYSSTQTIANNSSAIKTALKSANSSLTNTDLSKITFTATGSFVPGTAKTLTATITVGTATATKTLNVTLAQTDQQKADAIKVKITNPTLTVPVRTNPNTSNAQTATAIKTALQSANSFLTTNDLAKISFNNTTLVAEKVISVTATITVKRATATKTLNITLAGTDQQKADAIRDKITNTNFTFRIPPPFSTQLTSININALKKELKIQNAALTNDDLAKMSFTQSDFFIRRTTVRVTATITVGAASASISLSLYIDIARRS